MKSITRRRFVSTSAASLAVPYIFTARGAVAQEGDDHRPTIGCIGVGGRGSGVSKWAARFGRIVAVCDADLQHAERFKAGAAPTADVYQDYRRVLERDDIDVIIQGTPDHWHTKINVEALLSGKDVYGEKPLTLTVEEGKILRRVVEQTGGVFQTGTMQRSDRRFQTAVELVRNGRIGKLKQVWVALPFYSTKGGPFAEQPIPKSLDWDLYQGQAPEHYYTPYRVHQIFRWWYEYAGGIVTDWGNHHVDIAQWGMDCDNSGPIRVDARGLFPNEGKAECFNTPDRFFSRMTYASGIDVLYFSALNQQRIYGAVEKCVETTLEQSKWLFGDDCPEEIPTYNRDGIMFIGDKGKIFVNRGGLYGKPVEELAENPLPEDAWRVSPSSDHMQNFFECVRTRKTPVAPAAVEHRTVTCCHLTNLSIRLGRPLNWNPETETIEGDTEAVAMLSREPRKGYEIDMG